MNNSKNLITDNSAKFIQSLFQKNGIDKLNFHNIQHTIHVVQAVDEIGTALQLSPEMKEGLTLAAWFHDSGHIKKYQGHEEESKSLAKRFLVKQNYPVEKIQMIIGCIEATRMPQQPTNMLEEIICDADLYHLSTSEYWMEQRKLRLEWAGVLKKEFSDQEWFEQNLKFLDAHQYFTTYGKTVLEKRKRKNMEDFRAHFFEMFGRNGNSEKE